MASAVVFFEKEDQTIPLPTALNRLE